MAARDHLLEGEMILSMCKPFYATNRRLLRVETAGSAEVVYELPYYRVESVELTREPRQKLAFGGIFLAFAGFVLMAMGIIVITAIPLMLAGVAMIFVGARGREGYYQFRAYQMPNEELRRWQIPFRGSAGLIITIGEYVHGPVKLT
jgi:hypothetical protein